MELIDSHTHLDVQDFDLDRGEVIQRAFESKVKKIVNIGATNRFAGAERSLKLTEEYEGIYCSIGLHPHDADTPLDKNKLQVLAQNPKVVAIGETGLDFYRDWSPKDMQYAWFELQVELAKELKLPLVIHSRSAAQECVEVLKRLQAFDVGGVFHCYSEDTEFAHQLFDMNFILSITGAVTFRKADLLREVVKNVPLDKMMVETDAPYLAPEPFRGKRCESSHVVHTAEKIAEIRGIPLEEVARVTTSTAESFFQFNRSL